MTQQSLAQTQAKHSLGLYYTTNANLVNKNATGDFYTRLDSKWSSSVSEVPFFIGFSWLNYSKETSNSFLSLAVSAEIEATQFNTSSTYWLPKVFHRNYLQDKAATSDTSFTHTGIGLDLEKNFQGSSNLKYSVLAGYETRFFSKFQNRNDHEFHLLSDFDYPLNSELKISGFAGLGLVFSNLSEYSRNYLEFGSGIKSDSKKELDWSIDLSLIQTTYVNRTISQATEITNRRGAISTQIVETKESTQLVNLKAELIYNYLPQWKFNSGISLSSQSSNNIVNQYSDVEISISLITTAFP